MGFDTATVADASEAAIAGGLDDRREAGADEDAAGAKVGGATGLTAVTRTGSLDGGDWRGLANTAGVDVTAVSSAAGMSSVGTLSTCATAASRRAVSAAAAASEGGGGVAM